MQCSPTAGRATCSGGGPHEALVRSDRNGLLGVLAAFEVCRRLEEERR